MHGPVLVRNVWPCLRQEASTGRPSSSSTYIPFLNLLQARETGGDELDDLVSAPRMVLQQYIDKWFPEDPEEIARMSEKALSKLLLDVSGACWCCLGVDGISQGKGSLRRFQGC